jgi:hypothetical protein
MTHEPLASNWTAYHTPESVRRAELPAGHVERRPLLDKPSEPRPIINALMDEALLRIMLVSDGAVSSYEPLEIVKERVDRTVPMQRALAAAASYNHAGKTQGTRAPTSALLKTVERLGTDFTQSRTHRARFEVIKEAQTTAIRLKHAPWRAIRGDDEWKQKVADDPRSCRVLAVVYGVGVTTVKRIKKDAGTSRAQGRPKRSTG